MKPNTFLLTYQKQHQQTDRRTEEEEDEEESFHTIICLSVVHKLQVCSFALKYNSVKLLVI